MYSDSLIDMPLLESIQLLGQALLGNDYYVFSNLPSLKELTINGTGEGEIRELTVASKYERRKWCVDASSLEKLVLGGGYDKLSGLHLESEEWRSEWMIDVDALTELVLGDNVLSNVETMEFRGVWEGVRWTNRLTFTNYIQSQSICFEKCWYPLFHK